MSRPPTRAFLAALSALALSIPGLAAASTLHIQFTGLDLVYENDRLHTVGDPDPLTTLTIGYDGNDDGIVDGPVEVVTTGISLSFDSPLSDSNGDPIPLGGGSVLVPSGASSMSLSIGEGSLGTDAFSWTATYLPMDYGSFFFGSGSWDSIDGQGLPFGLADATLPVRFSFSAQVVPGTPNEVGPDLTQFRANGTGEVLVAAPEPGTALLLGAGLLGLRFAGRRSR